MPKNAFLGLFFEKVACGAKRLVNIGRVFRVIWDSSENQFGRPTKKIGREKFPNFFSESAPLEKLLDPRLVLVMEVSKVP